MSSPPRAPRLVLATRNAHKVVEMRAILADAVAELTGIRRPDLQDVVVGLDSYDAPDVAETGVTFADNALLKARAAADLTGLPAVADDSGLAVDVLGGAPGVFSARWCGRHGDDAANLELLLAQLADVPDEHRGARFVCAIALVHPRGPADGVDAADRTAAREHVEHGELVGVLERSACGAGGFGYDPVLRPDGHACTLAELDPDQKNAISHRGRALRAVASQLVPLVAPGR